MKVLMINGSPDPKGCISTALQEAVKVFEKEGVECEIMHIGNQDIRDETALLGRIVETVAIGTGESLDNGILHIPLILGSLHRGIAGTGSHQHLPDSLRGRRFLAAVGILHMTKRNTIYLVSVFLRILCRNSHDAAKDGCKRHKHLFHIQS